MKINCCICETNSYEVPYKVIKGFHLVKCKKCKLIYLKEFNQYIEDFISKAEKDLDKNNNDKVEYWGFPHIYEKYKDVFDYYFTERLVRIRCFKNDIKSVFDIGCGYGFWMKFCQEKGLEVEGIDISEEAVDWAKNMYGLDAKRILLEKFQFEKRYDAIVMCDILEHLIEPNQQLLKVKKALNPDGIIYIQVPNLLGFKIPPSQGFGLPFHIWQFNLNTLNKLLERNGFRVIAKWTGIMGVIGVYERGGPAYWQKILWKIAKVFNIGNRLQVIATLANI